MCITSLSVSAFVYMNIKKEMNICLCVQFTLLQHSPDRHESLRSYVFFPRKDFETCCFHIKVYGSAPLVFIVTMVNQWGYFIYLINH